MLPSNYDIQEVRRCMAAGELYHAFIPELVRERQRCRHACDRYNRAIEPSRRERVKMWRDIVQDTTPLPPEASTAEEDDALFDNDAWVEPSVNIDYGYNVKVGQNVFINFNMTILDTCLIEIGSRTLFGPNCSLFSGTHPLDPVVRNGTQGPELGKPISIGEDCWFGGNVIVLPGVRIGRGCIIGAGSVVTKDVPDFHIAAGNPARVLRKVETSMDPTQKPTKTSDQTAGAEVPMSEQ